MKKTDVKKMVGLAMFAAIIVVLQFVGNFIKFGNFSITLVLIPIIVGAALYGKYAGAFLGGVFGILVIYGCITGGDPLWALNPVLTGTVCMLKGMAAGFLSGLTFELVSKKNKYVAAYAAAVICPVVNTGIFCIALMTLFHNVLVEWAAGTNIIYYTFIIVVGINFILELAANIILAPVIVISMDAVKNMKR